MTCTSEAIADAIFTARYELAPDDLDGLPFYVLPADVIDDRYQRDCADGWTASCLDLQLQDWLQVRDRWKGRGPVAILTGRDLSPQRVKCVVAHELGHWLNYAIHPSARVELEKLTDESELQAAQACGQPHLTVDHRAERDATLACDQSPPWHSGNGLEFVRAMSHLYVRGRRAARFTRPEELVFAGEPYGLSPPAAYLDAFAPELADSAGSIIEILQTPAPRAARELFADDLDRWARAGGVS